MAMLFDQPLDDFSIEDPFGYATNSNSIIDHNFWDSEEFTLESIIPTPPLSPDQQLNLKEEINVVDLWDPDAEVERYLQCSSQNNIVLNDRIWCDEVFTPSEHSTPGLEDLVHIRPITPPPPIKTEFHCPTPLKVDDSPEKEPPPVLSYTVRIKDEPISPTSFTTMSFFGERPVKTSPESSYSSDFTTVAIKEEPVEYIPPKNDIIRSFRPVSVKEESSFEFLEDTHSELVNKARKSRHKGSKRSTSSSGQTSKVQIVKIEDKRIKQECRASNLFSGEAAEINEVYLKRKLYEMSSECSSSDDTLLSPKRRLSQPRCHKTSAGALAEEAASKLSIEQLKNLSANHSHPEDEPCGESCTKRFAHNVLERRRRNDLNQSYIRLQNEVPDICNTDRVSKVVVLKQASEYIKSVEREEQESKDELKRVRNHQKQLIDKFRQLFRLTQQHNTSPK